jgi:hypothetical protein
MAGMALFCGIAIFDGLALLMEWHFFGGMMA